MTLFARALVVLAFVLAGCSGADEPAAADRIADYQAIDGYLPLYFDDRGGRLLMAIERFDEPMIYQSSLARGVGSNDIGLDRGQLGATRRVRFVRAGSRVLLVQDNLDFRAQSDDPAEQLAVEESFARSVIHGFDVVSDAGRAVLVDATPFFVDDAHGIGPLLAEAEEGNYEVDTSRSAIYMPRTRGFPDNTEVEAVVTLVGEPAGPYLPTVVPDPRSVTVHVHHSFVRLPDDGYEPLPYDPRAGVIGLEYGASGFADYATPIGEPLFVNYGIRHRLEKVDPAADVSEAVEPIVYYVDPGAPEPVRSALIEGASWWNEAFEAAGYRNAFRVELLPEGADPMDVRYNVIQWVHRSTRGWSYGSAIVDPRSGEILKGHVTLGSLRVRQDYMIAEGLLAPYASGDVPDTMLEMSLARIRQLSAHEVGHTLGFEHNFAASTQDRASVMDYPVPLVRFADDGSLDLSDAYDEGIGAWDVRTVLHAYQHFPEQVDAGRARQALVEETLGLGFRYVADADARAVGSAHPHGNLWDNGDDPVAELEHLARVRAHALENFGERTVRPGRPLATIEETLVPIYLLHRFQLHAVGKLVGGSYFSYALRGDGQPATATVETPVQREAIDALVATLDPAFLRLPDGLAASIPPRPPGHPATRELFARPTGPTFDPLAPAAAGATLTIEVLLDPARAARLVRNGRPGFDEVLDRLLAATWYRGDPPQAGIDAAIHRQTSRLVLDALLRLAVHEAADPAVRGLALDAVEDLDDWLAGRASSERAVQAHWRLARASIDRMRSDPADVAGRPAVPVPPGSPIGGR